MWPMVLLLDGPVPEIGALPGDYLNIDPRRQPSIIVCRPAPMEDGRLYGWVFGLLVDDVATPVSASSLPALLASMAAIAGEPGHLEPRPLPPGSPLPWLVRVK